MRSWFQIAQTLALYRCQISMSSLRLIICLNLLKIIFSFLKNKLSEVNKTYIDIGNGQQGSNWLPKSGMTISNAAQRTMGQSIQ